MKSLALVSTLAALAIGVAAHAEDLDASKPLHCVFVAASDCDESASCEPVTLEQVGLPESWRVDFAGQRLVSEDGQRTSPITASETLDTALLLQGHQNGRGWTLVVERATGHLAATLADADGAFVLSGGCSTE